jgi:hypothetical protein
MAGVSASVAVQAWAVVGFIGSTLQDLSAAVVARCVPRTRTGGLPSKAKRAGRRDADRPVEAAGSGAGSGMQTGMQTGLQTGRHQPLDLFICVICCVM